MAEALIWEFKSTQNAHAHTFPDCKIRRNAEHSEQVPVRLLYPEPSHIFCQKSIYWKIKRSFKIDYRNYFCAHKPKFYSECQDWGLRGREKTCELINSALLLWVRHPPSQPHADETFMPLHRVFSLSLNFNLSFPTSYVAYAEYVMALGIKVSLALIWDAA